MEIDRQLLKGTIPLLVLRLLDRGELYGYQLIKSLDELSAGAFRFSEGSLYPVLHSLERDGLLSAHWQSGESGRKRKYYTITGRGRAELAARLRQWRTFAAAIETVLAEEPPDA